MSDFYNETPYTHAGTWQVFPGAIFSNLDLSDCNDTIDGICHHAETLSECIDLCKNDQNKLCRTGYFIQTPDRANYCVPLRQHNKEETSPYYRLRNKNIYPILKNMKTFVFSDFPYPPNAPNALFYTDHFVFKNISKNIHIGMTENASMTENVVFTNDNPIHIQFLPSQVARNYVENYVFVRNGDEIVINIPHTAFVLRKNDLDSQISWTMRAAVTNVPSNIFQIFTKNKKIGDILDYSDEFYFTFQGQPMVYNDLNMLSISSSSIQNSIENKDNIFFQLIPKIEVNYCENGVCKTTSLDQTETDGVQARFKNIPVERSPTCWGKCGKKKSKWYLILIGIVVFIIILKLALS